MLRIKKKWIEYSKRNLQKSVIFLYAIYIRLKDIMKRGDGIFFIE